VPRTKAPDCIIFDFETKGILPRPNYPPKAVSLALKWPDRSDYILMAWGHGDGTKAHGNNCTEKQGRGELVKAYNSRYPILTQYGSFDHDVAEAHWDLPILPWERTYDTMYLTFLDDPHAESLALKPTAERLLGIPPEEQDRVKEWVLANVPEAKKKPSEWGQYLWMCPYQIVKPYHKGDLVRTGRLFNLLYPRIIDAEMGKAYDRDRRLMPILLRNARVGMRTDVDGLERDLPAMKAGVEKADVWLRKRLGIDNIDSDRQLGEALYNKGIVTEFKRTPKGQLSVSKKYLILDRFKDKRVYHALQYRGQMATCINMFAEPWLELGTVGHGSLFPNWSQVRSSRNGGKDMSGARSGRIICSRPNFLNIPKKWKRAASSGYVHPAWLRVPELPYMRQYCLPDNGEQWGKRDFNQQELRLFGHFEEGQVMQGFLNDPKFDIHENVRAEAERRLIEAMLRDSFDRDTAKTCVFGRVYGQGLSGLMDALHLPEEDKPVAQIIQRAINAAVPSIKELDDQLKELARDKSYGPNGAPIRTWGGRLYYCEPPTYSEFYGRDMTYEYKLLNYLLQGSGADVTKETLIRYDSHPKRRGRFVVTVYDEINFSCPPKAMKEEQKIMKECMLSIETDIPMLSDGEVGPNWGFLEKFKEVA
jgi:DNA polymerase I-like protein with 3'-5' exonuclease and polymerase domains